MIGRIWRGDILGGNKGGDREISSLRILISLNYIFVNAKCWE